MVSSAAIPRARCRTRRWSARPRAVRRSAPTTTDGRAPSIPATTTRQSAASSRFRTRAAGAGRRPLRRRCGRPPRRERRPSGPPSLATGASEVPAATTATRPRGSGRGPRVTARATRSIFGPGRPGRRRRAPLTVRRVASTRARDAWSSQRPQTHHLLSGSCWSCRRPGSPCVPRGRRPRARESGGRRSEGRADPRHGEPMAGGRRSRRRSRRLPLSVVGCWLSGGSAGEEEQQMPKFE